jgi:hypothetical protein
MMAGLGLGPGAPRANSLLNNSVSQAAGGGRQTDVGARPASRRAQAADQLVVKATTGLGSARPGRGSAPGPDADSAPPEADTARPLIADGHLRHAGPQREERRHLVSGAGGRSSATHDWTSPAMHHPAGVDGAAAATRRLDQVRSWPDCTGWTCRSRCMSDLRPPSLMSASLGRERRDAGGTAGWPSGMNGSTRTGDCRR